MKRIEEIEARLQALDGALEEYDRTRSSTRSVGAYLEVAGNAPSDLRYLLDFAKAAREALELYGDGHNYLAPLHQNATYFDAGQKARAALALLETP